MATIGYATLQIIPSLLGVTEAIEKQIAGQVVPVTIEPKVDKRAIEKAGKQTRETIEKQTKQVTVEPKVERREGGPVLVIPHDAGYGIVEEPMSALN